MRASKYEMPSMQGTARSAGSNVNDVSGPDDGPEERLLEARIEPSNDDRRREPRYVPVQRTAYLGWWDGPTYRTTVARVDSLSCHGAALLVDALPPGLESVWLYLIGPVSSLWFAADVINRSQSSEAGQTVRLALREMLPYDIFKTFILGFPPEDAPVQ